MINNPTLAGLYIGISIGFMFLGYSLIKYRKAPDFMQIAVIILSCCGAIVGLDLGYIGLTVDNSSLGELASQRVPVVLGALAVIWTAIETLVKTCKQSIEKVAKQVSPTSYPDRVAEENRGRHH